MSNKKATVWWVGVCLVMGASLSRLWNGVVVLNPPLERRDVDRFPSENETKPLLCNCTNVTTTHTTSCTNITADSSSPPNAAATVAINKEEEQQLKETNDSDNKNNKDPRVVFLHIGKTGGSSGRCMLRPELGEGTCRNGQFLQQIASKPNDGTAIFNRTVAVCHQLECHSLREARPVANPRATVPSNWAVENFSTVLLSIRNPYERIVSWFLYARAIYRAGDFESGSNKANALRCFSEFNDLARAVAEYYHDSNNINNSIHTNNSAPSKLPLVPNTTFTEQECRKFAHDCVKGTAKCLSDHNWQGYQYYLNAFLRHDKPISTMYVIRNEYKWQDFYTTNLLLGGTATSFHPDSVSLPSARKSKGQRDEGLPNATRTILCRVMCDELHVYEFLLKQSVNLHLVQIQTSLQELQDSCGGVPLTQLCPPNPHL